MRGERASVGEVSDEQRLRKAAIEVSARAYCPHSGFKVGAAVLDHSGNIHKGCNVESDSYGLTQCAERTAVAAAIAAGVGKGEMSLVVIYVPGLLPIPPCGACRQVMMELLPEEAVIITTCDGTDQLQWTRDELMPDAFSMQSMQK